MPSSLSLAKIKSLPSPPRGRDWVLNTQGVSNFQFFLQYLAFFLNYSEPSVVTYNKRPTEPTTRVFFIKCLLVWFAAGMVFVFLQKLLLLKSTLCVRGENILGTMKTDMGKSFLAKFK